MYACVGGNDACEVRERNEIVPCNLGQESRPGDIVRRGVRGRGGEEGNADGRGVGGGICHKTKGKSLEEFKERRTKRSERPATAK